MQVFSSENPTLSRPRGQPRIATVNGVIVDPIIKLAHAMIHQFRELDFFDEPAMAVEIQPSYSYEQKSAVMLYLRSIGWSVQPTDPLDPACNQLWLRPMSA